MSLSWDGPPDDTLPDGIDNGLDESGNVRADLDTGHEGPAHYTYTRYEVSAHRYPDDSMRMHLGAYHTLKQAIAAGDKHATRAPKPCYIRIHKVITTHERIYAANYLRQPRKRTK